MTNSAGQGESVDPPDASSDPFGSFPLSDPMIILGETDVEVSSPLFPHSNAANRTSTGAPFTLSSEHLEIPSTENFSATPDRLSRPPRKRGPGLFLFQDRTNKTPRFSQETNNSPRDLILNARDLIVQAYTITKARDEQSKLLDLLEVFREYTEKGRIQAASSIIASQVANLETAPKKFENKAKTLEKTSAPIRNQPIDSHSLNSLGNKPLTFAGIASQGSNSSTSPQEWTIVGKKNKIPPPKPTKPAAKNRLILVKSVTSNNTDFSPLATRNALNKAFSDKGIKEPVVAAVSKTLGQNLVLTTTDAFSADFLLEKLDLWQHLVPFKVAQKDEPWHKVAVHGIPIADFNTPDGMALVTEEIQIFNKGLKPIGTPYWLTSAEKRLNQRSGSLAIAFATKEEADRAIRNRLYIAGISARVEKLYSTAPTTQCQRCQGFGHLENHCKRGPFCKLCGERHATQQHNCNSCQAKGSRCQHLTPKCANCKESHTADTQTCEVLLAIKNKGTAIHL
jgi:hypothetical protein